MRAPQLPRRDTAMMRDHFQLLHDAVARNGALVVSLPSAPGLLRHQKSRFVGGDAAGLWIESTAADRELVDELIRSGQPAGVSIRTGDTRLAFTSPLLRRDPIYALGPDLTVEAALLQHPAEVRTIQRRASYRAAVVPDSDLSLRIWRMGRAAYLKDRPAAAQEIGAQLLDISTGGIGVVLLSRNQQPPRVAPEDRLRIQLTLPEGQELLLEGRLRYPVKSADGATEVRAGIQFRRLNDDLHERQAFAVLDKLVGEMQRGEARRVRLGMV